MTVEQYLKEHPEYAVRFAGHSLDEVCMPDGTSIRGLIESRIRLESILEEEEQQ